MSNDDQYLHNATEAQRQANAAHSDHDKASWLHIAQGWLSLLRGPKKPSDSDEGFSEKLEAKGTKQECSDSSH